MKAEEQTPMEILFNELYDNRHSMFDRNSGQLKEEVKEKFLKLETEAIQQEREKWKEVLREEIEKAHTEGQGYVIEYDNLNHGRHPIASVGYYKTQVKPRIESK